MALSAETSRLVRMGDRMIRDNLAVKTGVTIYKGALTMVVEATGRLTNAAATAGHSDVRGVALETKTGNTAGTVTCAYGFGHIEKLTTKTALTRAFVSCEAFVFDNDLVTTTAVGTAGVRVGVGEIVSFDGGAGGAAGSCWVWIGVHARKAIP